MLPARFDDTPLPGLPPDVSYIDLRGRMPQQFAATIAAKLASLGIGPSSSLGEAEQARQQGFRRRLSAMLDADIQLRLSRLNLDTAFTVASGEVLALLGPNGSGKSTTLRALMGLLPLTGGRVVLDGTVLEDPAQDVKIPPENRPIGLMFQDYLLFPHLSAVENVAFGLRAKGTAKKAARDQARRRWPAWAWTAWPRPSPVDVRRAAAAVAMARALVTDPKLLLLEPRPRSTSRSRPTSAVCCVRYCAGPAPRTCTVRPAAVWAEPAARSPRVSQRQYPSRSPNKEG